MKPRLVVVGNLACRRVALWQAAAARAGWAGFAVLPYANLLQDRAAPIAPDTVVRMESAADNWDTYKLLLKHGANAARRLGYPALDEDAVDRLEHDRGWVICPRQAHLGYLRLLETLDSQLSGAATMQSTEEIATCFDKPSCQARLARQGVPIPTCFGSPKSYGELRKRVRGERRVMLKLAHGSGAAGCVAIHFTNGGTRGVTTVARVSVRDEARWYHSKRPVYLADEAAVAALVDRLCVEEVQAEAWLPKARWQGRNIDLRIVTIDSVPRHAVVRSSTSVFTNLTLGGRRGDLAGVVRRMGPHGWERVRDTCRAVAAAFPRSFTLGIDLLVRPDWRRHAVLEVNAFGDLLLNQLDDGEDTHTATLNAWQRRHASVGQEAPAP